MFMRKTFLCQLHCHIYTTAGQLLPASCFKRTLSRGAASCSGVTQPYGRSPTAAALAANVLPVMSQVEV